MIVSVSDFNSFLKKILSEELLSIQQIIIPSKSRLTSNDNLFFRPLRNDNDTIDLGNNRTIDPVKILFYSPREKVFPSEYIGKRRLIAGLKACDINALSILDTALTRSGFTDPSYKQFRDNSIIISTDCTNLLPNCFCTFLGEKPFAETGFDLNLSELHGQYFITVGSKKGEELLGLMKEHTNVHNCSHDIVQEVKTRRDKLVEKLNHQIQSALKASEIKYPDMNENALWIESSGNCVGCGSCTNICPSCYCLILNDESKGIKKIDYDSPQPNEYSNEFIKVRTYDSCQLHGYARVAGGGTPRPKVYQRFRNRVMCKFSYMKSNFSTFGCTGCGRCMDVCALGFDFVMLAKHVINSSAQTAHTVNSDSFEISQKVNNP